MHDIDLLARCSKRYCEVLPDNLSMTECMVEEVFGRVLGKFYEVVLIGDVSLSFWPISDTQDTQTPPIAVSLRAQGCDPISQQSCDYLGGTIKEQLSSALSELLGTLNVERFAIN